VYIAWRNLVYKKLRAFLTIFGVVIGIGAIYFLLSFGIGLQHLVTSQVVGNQSVKSVDITSTNSKIVKLDQKSFQKIKNLPHVVRIGASYSYAASVKYKGGETDSVSYGVDTNYQTLSDLHVISGRALQSNDNRSLVINKAALQTFGLPQGKQALGKKLNVKIPLELAGGTSVDASFTVVGIVDAGSGVEVYLPDYVFQVAGVDTYTQFKLESDTSAHVANLRSQIESMGFQTTSPIDTISQINQIFKFFNLILAGFGAIGMIVAVLGMFNTLTISLLERTKEIGLMLALGGRNRDMKKLFIFEAVLLSLSGAVIGIVLASIGGEIINVVMNQFAAHRGVTQRFDLFATPLWLTGGTISFMLLVGLAVVYFPARHAERINPIEALRRE
jgi:putative ABC transport system permease protein